MGPTQGRVGAGMRGGAKWVREGTEWRSGTIRGVMITSLRLVNAEMGDKTKRNAQGCDDGRDLGIEEFEGCGNVR